MRGFCDHIRNFALVNYVINKVSFLEDLLKLRTCSCKILALSTDTLMCLCRDVTRTLIGRGGGCLFIYSCSVRQISFEFELISKEIRRA